MESEEWKGWIRKHSSRIFAFCGLGTVLFFYDFQGKGMFFGFVLLALVIWLGTRLDKLTKKPIYKRSKKESVVQIVTDAVIMSSLMHLMTDGGVSGKIFVLLIFTFGDLMVEGLEALLGPLGKKTLPGWISFILVAFFPQP